MSPRRLLGLSVALILYASLYPFRFEWQRYVAAWEDSLVDALSFKYSGPGDALANLVAYIPIGIFARLSLPRNGLRNHLLPVAGGLMLSMTAEFLQIGIRSRNPSWMDVLWNVSSTIAGVALADWLWYRVAAKFEHISRARIPSIVFLLGLVWVAMHSAPFVPALGMSKIRAALAPLRIFQWTPEGVAMWFAGWMIAGSLGRAAARGRIPFVAVFGSTAILSLGMEILFLNHVLSWNEIIALGLATPVLFWTNPWAHAILACAALLISGLAPFRFQDTAGRFGWIPFQGLLESDLGDAFRIATEKCYLYAGSVWLLYRAGLSKLASGATVALFLFGIEWTQRYLPGRTPEISDPLIALLAIMLLEGKSE